MTGELANSGLSPTRGLLLVGAGVLIFGWLCPLFLPLVLGGDFWDKIRSLFVHAARAHFAVAPG